MQHECEYQGLDMVKDGNDTEKRGVYCLLTGSSCVYRICNHRYGVVKDDLRNVQAYVTKKKRKLKRKIKRIVDLL